MDTKVMAYQKRTRRVEALAAAVYLGAAITLGSLALHENDEAIKDQAVATILEGQHNPAAASEEYEADGAKDLRIAFGGEAVVFLGVATLFNKVRKARFCIEQTPEPENEGYGCFDSDGNEDPYGYDSYGYFIDT